MNIKKGDNVKMLQGKDRGKTGKILIAYPQDSKVKVEGLNTIKKHQRARQQGQTGQIITVERRVDSSIVALICPKCGKATRVGHKTEGGVKMRSCKKCQATFN